MGERGWEARERGGGRLGREGVDIYLQLIHVVVQQKLAQHCKAVILQLKIKKIYYTPPKKEAGPLHSLKY